MPHIDHIVLNENAYFFKKEIDRFYTKKHIDELFFEASAKKTGGYLLNIRKENETLNGEDIQYSICVFKYLSTPSFLDEPIPKWEEQKLAYLLLIDFKDYVFITKKNISGVDSLLLKWLSPIDYKTLVSLFVNDSTNFEKFSLSNTNISSESIKGKTIEANDLKKSFSAFGAGKYVLSTVRLNNEEEKTTISFNTSRITNFGGKKYINELFIWGWNTIDKIRNHIHSNTFLNIFAESIEYEQNRNDLIPISILFNLTRLHDNIERGNIVGCRLSSTSGIKNIPIKKVLSFLSNVFSIERQGEDEDSLFILSNSFLDDIAVNLNRKSITLSSIRAKKIALVFDDGSTMDLLTYFNQYNDFIINFEDLSLVYTNRKLFKDNKLIGYIDNFINVFKGKNELTETASEKGTFTQASTLFSNDSVFGYIESNVTHHANYVFLDDLGNEWADFIKLTNDSISLIHAKHSTSSLSASSFHDIVSQALKNIGNLSPSDAQLENKIPIWNTRYNIENTATNIDRLRRGDNVDNGITAYKKLLVTPNLTKEIILVVDFISRAHLKDRLQKLQNGESFQEKNQVIQLLWIISSLINSCSENGIDIHIHCKP